MRLLSESSLKQKSKSAQAFTMIAGPLANLLLAVILLTGYFAFRGYEIWIARIAENSPAAAAGQKETDMSYGGKRTHIPLDVIQFLYVSKGRKPVTVEFERTASCSGGTGFISALKLRLP